HHHLEFKTSVHQPDLAIAKPSLPYSNTLYTAVLAKPGVRSGFVFAFVILLRNKLRNEMLGNSPN
ncbi:hypothetical protein RI534_00380, partial [Aeromonas allosaccharophila]|uniref:hypothetical protein n=1 Tax=Aeromonas allosaccharophila TaxID=656 RepID=UPI003434939F